MNPFLDPKESHKVALRNALYQLAGMAFLKATYQNAVKEGEGQEKAQDLLKHVLDKWEEVCRSSLFEATEKYEAGDSLLQALLKQAGLNMEQMQAEGVVIIKEVRKEIEAGRIE